MQAQSVRDLGALVRSARRAHGMTQADLAERLSVSRDWVVRLEHGHPRLEAQRVLDALAVVGLSLNVSTPAAPSAAAARKSSVTGKAPRSTGSGAKQVSKRVQPKARKRAATSKTGAASAKSDPFAFLAQGK